MCDVLGDASLRRQVALGDFRRLAISLTKRLLIQSRQAEELKAGASFVSRDEALVIRRLTIDLAIEDVEAVAMDAMNRFPAMEKTVDGARRLLREFAEVENSDNILVAFAELMNLFQVPQAIDAAHSFVLTADGTILNITAESIADTPHGLSLIALQSQYDDQAFLRTVVNRIAASRMAGKALSRDDLVGISAAYRLLDRGVTLPPDYLSIGTYGFRTHQTRLSLADPGDGHISVTCSDKRLLDGVIVHIEHIDREGVDDREIVEPYRLPAALNAARVRLHAGSAAPCTAYIGRPLFENGVNVWARTEAPAYLPVTFAHDLLKTAHMTASACSSMFINGVADCKIAIERMAYRDIITFMTAVAGNVMRDPSRQYLSAAFNLNLPIWDNRGAVPTLISDRYDIALAAIELASTGQFDKVTWDSASNKVPSDPIIKQLSHAQWVTLVHLAHEKGLETYISAGLKSQDMGECVAIGVDGVGIGTSLHYTDKARPMGQLKPEAIIDALQTRDAAAQSLQGVAAKLLARLDRMFFEKILPVVVNPDRNRLFEALRDQDMAILQTLVKTLGAVGDAQADAGAGQDHPVLKQAERALASAGARSLGEMDLGVEKWGRRLAAIDQLLQAKDVNGLREVMQ